MIQCSPNHISQIQTHHLLKRFPSFELSYETIAHKKVFDSQNISLAIPNGKKYFAWFTFYQDKDVCFLMELNREKKISVVQKIDVKFDPSLSLGTILYGTFIPSLTETNQRSFFLIEEMYYYKGIYLKNMTFGDKLGYIELLFSKNDLFQNCINSCIIFALPFIWGVKTNTEEDILNEFENIKSKIPYHVHHIQLRQLTKINPYLNIPLNTILSRMNQREKDKNNIQPCSISIQKSCYSMDYTKPQYKYPTVFRVIPDIQYDIYHLYAYGKNHEPIYYNTAYIPNIEKSVFMNNLFRDIRENSNLDYIEESDDEEDFETIAVDKYVDLNKVYNLVCSFNTKFKRWVPLRIAEKDSKIVHISKLVHGYNM